MPIKVNNLTIKPQTGNPGTFYASWSFGETTTTTSSSIKAGDLVSIKSGATYYNGVAIPSWVLNQKWYIKSVTGDRAVLGKNASGSNDINSPINTKYLVGGSSTTTTTTVNNLDHYEVTWYYDSGDGWFMAGSASEVTEKNATYSPPSYAIKFKVTVKPVAKTTTDKNGKETSPWTGTVASAEYSIDAAPPEKPAVPNVEIDKFKLTAKLENISDARTDEIQFQVLNGTDVVETIDSKVITCRASMSCNVVAGGEYRVRCRAINVNGSSKVYSDWTEYSSPEETIPAVPSGKPILKATSKTSIYIEWIASPTAKTYDIEYTTKQSYFDGSDQTTVISDVEFTHYEKTGLESGQTYFFRVRAVNDSGNTAWSDISSIVIGSEPTSPTTWSSTTTATVGEVVNLYWVHNCADGSDWRYSELEVYLDGEKQVISPIKNEQVDSEDNENPTIMYSIDTSKFAEGAQIQWRVRTSGVTLAYGDWSIQRTIDVYAPPVLTLKVTDVEEKPIETLTSFPFYIYAIAGPNTQTPLGYHVTITSNEVYETVDNIGNVKMVNAGEAVYSKYFDITDSLLVEMSPANVNLDNGISYTVTCVVSMNSGLTAESTSTFTVNWKDDIYYPNAEIAIDRYALVAHVRPYCEESSITYYKVTKSGYKYTKTDEIIDIEMVGNLVSGSVTTTTTGEDVFTYTTGDGVTVYYCEIETRTLIDGITLSLYRREFDGTFTELATGLQNTDYTFVTDPHPALDYARYRVVAVTDSTGAISFYDVPGYPTGVSDIVIQWDEKWINFDGGNEDAMAQSPWSGSLLRLPYNVDVSETTQPDVALVNYIGREHPVSYYGTQVGQTATWNADIISDDKDTIYALRRLQRWMGDVYVREPSGSGYWANITVQFDQKHRELVTPVSLSITRVEGGI